MPAIDRHRVLSAGLVTSLALAVAACGAPPAASPSPTTPPSAGPIELTWRFDDSLQGFAVDITDFHAETRGELRSELVALPAPLTGNGLRVFANNYSDDLWHFLWREIGPAEGVVAGTTYRVTIALQVASNVASGCMGVGGSPDSVTLKGGVVAVQPAPVTDAEGYIGFSADKGNQVNVGPDAVDLGTIGTDGTDCEGSSNPWEVLERSGTMTATATDDGRLWVYVGGDSGFESATTLHYLSVGVTLDPQ